MTPKCKPLDVVLVDADDWQAIYVDGCLAIQDHRVAQRWLEDVGRAYLTFRVVYVTEADDELLQQMGHMPDFLADLECAYDS